MKTKLRELVNNNRAIRTVIAFLLCFISILIVYALFDITPFGNKSLLVDDMGRQYFQYMSYFKNNYASLLSSNYSFSQSLGSEFLSSFAFFLASPLLWLFYAFTNIENLALLTLYSALKTALCGCAMFYYLDNNRSRSVLNYGFALSYCLMGYILTMNQNLMYIDSIILLPILIMGIEKLVNTGKPLFAIFAVAISMFTNFYSGYIIVAFGALYIVYYCLINDKKVMSNFLKYIGVSIVGCMLVAFILIPSFLNIYQNRASEPAGTMFFNLNEIKTIFGVLWGQYNNNDNTSITTIYYGVITFMMSLSFFTSKEYSKRSKLISGIFVLVLLATYIIMPINKLWHLLTIPKGFPNRYTFCFVFYLILLAKQGSEKLINQGFKQLLIIIVVPLILLLTAYGLQLDSFASDSLLTNAIIVTISGFIIVMLAKRNNKVFMALAVLLCSIELVSNNVNTLNQANERAYAYASVDDYFTLTYAPRELIDNIDDDSIYRLENANPYSQNDSLLFDYKGIATYVSSYKKNTMDFLINLGFTGKSNYLYYAGETSLTNSILGVKYVISDKNYIDYSLVNSVGDRSLYKNNSVLPIAYIIDETTTDEFTDNQIDNLKSLGKYVFGDTSLIENPYAEFQFEYFNAYLYDANNENKIFPVDEDEQWFLHGSITAKDNNPIYLYIPNSDKDIYQLWVNDKWQGRVLGSDTSVLYVGTFNEGDTVELKLKPSDSYISFDSYELFVIDNSQLSLDVDKVLGNGVPEINIDDSRVSIQCTANSRQVLFTTIPYDQGWAISVNGEKIVPQVYQNALITIPLMPGQNTIEMVYTPKGLVLGCILAAIAFAIVVVIVLKGKRHVSE